MKHEAEEQLLKTLNGQINELPGVAKTMVQQYQMSAIVLSVLCAIALIVLAVAMIKAKDCVKNNWRIFDAASIDIGMIWLVLGIAISFDVLFLCINIIHACTPITSIIKSIFGD